MGCFGRFGEDALVARDAGAAQATGGLAMNDLEQESRALFETSVATARRDKRAPAAAGATFRFGGFR
jgi:hypothetical protein